MKGRGFTLLEVMIALAILSLVLVVLFSQQATSIDQGNEARIVTKATFLAQERMTELITQDRLSIGEEGGEMPDAIPPFRWKQMVEESETEGMKRVTVLVLWKEGDKGRDLRLVTYVASEE